MKDRLRKSRYKPNAEMPINANVFHLGKKSRKTLKKYLKFLKSVSLPMLGENLFKNKEEDE